MPLPRHLSCTAFILLAASIAYGCSGSLASESGGNGNSKPVRANDDVGAGGGNVQKEEQDDGTPGVASCSAADRTQFELTADPKTAFCDSDPTVVGCTNPQDFLTILRVNSDGTPPTPINWQVGCTRSCLKCAVDEPLSCPSICSQPQRASTKIAEWQGEATSEKTCPAGEPGAFSGGSCTKLRCAPHGRYIARMCLFRVADAADQCTPRNASQTAERKCVDVPFELPSRDVVRGVL